MAGKAHAGVCGGSSAALAHFQSSLVASVAETKCCVRYSKCYKILLLIRVCNRQIT